MIFILDTAWTLHPENIGHIRSSFNLGSIELTRIKNSIFVIFGLKIFLIPEHL